jgi:HK97 family phage major capsid protein
MASLEPNHSLLKTEAKMAISSDLMVKKHASGFLRNINARSLSDYTIWNKNWADLQKIKRDASRTVGDLVDQVSDGLAEKKAAELEVAYDRLSDFIGDISSELDRRSAAGVKTPISDPSLPDTSRIPAVVERTAPAGDWGYDCAEGDEAFALRSDQSFRTWAQPLAHSSHEGLTLGKYLRSMIVGAASDVEHRALSEGTDSAGGYTVPTVLAGEMIDRLRAESVMVAAGARTVPLTSDNLSIAKLATDPTPAFRAENAAIAESDPTFSSVTLTPRSLAVMTKVSRELFEDSLNLESELPRILSVAMAKEMDRIGLLGSGSAPEPRGISNQSGIGTTALDAALTSYAPLLAAQTGILSANAGPVSAMIMHPRDAGDLAGLTDTTNQPLNAPATLSGIPMLTTTAIPTDGGTGSNESTIFVGNFSHVMIGVRSGVRVDVLRERYADSHQYGLVAHMRFDIAVQHAAAFHTITGVQS